MSSIESISNTASQAQSFGTSSPWAGVRQDFKDLDNALLNDDLNSAQAVFASLQQAVSSTQASGNPNSILSQLGQTTSPLGQDLQALSAALGANDLSGAQKAFAKLQQEMQSAFQANGASNAHHHHHAHGVQGSDADAHITSGAMQNSSVTQLSTLLQSLSTSDTADSGISDLAKALQSLTSSNPKLAADIVTLLNDFNGSGTVVNTTA